MPESGSQRPALFKCKADLHGAAAGATRKDENGGRSSLQCSCVGLTGTADPWIPAPRLREGMLRGNDS